MAIVMNMQWSGVTKVQYDQTLALVKWETETPTGAKFHVASFDERGSESQMSGTVRRISTGSSNSA